MFYVCMYYCDAYMEGIKVRKMICDRCGEEIDTSYMDKYDIKPSAFCRIYGNKNSGIYSETEDLEYELCKDCTNQLVTFLKG